VSGLLLGVDVGATGIKVGFFALDGTLVESAGRRNGPVPQPGGEHGWLIWDGEEIWRKICASIQECLPTIGDAKRVKAIACTGFGADGTPLDKAGRQLYPFISWHCERTFPQSREIGQRLGNEHIFQITGYHNYGINTLNRFLWFKQNRPDIIEQTHQWLQMQDFIAFKFSGSFSTECTIASTMMMLDLAKRTWSPEMLKVAGVPASILPAASEAGTRIGSVTKRAAKESGLPEGVPVVTGGHDCEIAVLGAGVDREDVLIDITGTWEILIATVDRFEPQPAHFDQGLDFECHALPGKWICQSLLIAGAVTEWLRENCYRDCDESNAYETMFQEAAHSPANGVYMLPSFMPGMGPTAQHKSLGTLLGLTTTTNRGQLVRAALEGLCFQLRQQKEALEQVIGQRATAMRVVGGAQKNPLWLQLKADATGIPVEVTAHPEVTLLGAAMLAGVGAGVFNSIDEALQSVERPVTTYTPNMSTHAAMEERYQRVYCTIASSLSDTYAAIEKERA
jgi:L-fuculokinase